MWQVKKDVFGNSPSTEKHSASKSNKPISGSRSKTEEDIAVEKTVGVAEEMKLEGNALFKDGKLTEAIQQYEKVLAYLGDTLVASSSHKHREMVLGVKIPCHLNIAAGFLKLERHEEAINHSNFVLAEDENHVKALYRRGKAKAELGRTDAAREDFLKASNLLPTDKTLKNELLLLAENEKKAVYEKQKELYKGIFGPRVETDTDTDTKHDDNILQGNINNSATPKLTHRVRAHYDGSGDHW